MAVDIKCTGCDKDLTSFLMGAKTITECPYCHAPLRPVSVKLAQGFTRGSVILLAGLFAGGIVFVLLILFSGDNAHALLPIEGLTPEVAAYLSAGVAVLVIVGMFVYYNLAIARGKDTVFDLKGPTYGGHIPTGEPLVKNCSSCATLYAWQPSPAVRAPDCPKCGTPTPPLPLENPQAPKARAVQMPPPTTADQIQIGVILGGATLGVLVLCVSLCLSSGVGIGVGVVLLLVAGGALVYGNPAGVKLAKERLAAAAGESTPDPMATPQQEPRPPASGTFAFACPCGKTLRVQKSFAGKKCKCPGCGQIRVVPGS